MWVTDIKYNTPVTCFICIVHVQQCIFITRQVVGKQNGGRRRIMHLTVCCFKHAHTSAILDLDHTVVPYTVQ